MREWPKTACKAFDEAYKFSNKDDLYALILKRLSAKALQLKELFETIDAKFENSFSELDGQGVKLVPEEIYFRFWKMFFEDFAYAASEHHPNREKELTSDLASYKELLKKIVVQANDLAKNLALIPIRRNKLTTHLELPHSQGYLDPLDWFLGSSEAESKSDVRLIRILKKLRYLHYRYENPKHWPSPESVLRYLSNEMALSLQSIETDGNGFKPLDRRSKLVGLLNTLSIDRKWAAETRWAWHLPRMFITTLSGSDLALLIEIAWEIRISVRSVNDARNKVLAIH